MNPYHDEKGRFTNAPGGRGKVRDKSMERLIRHATSGAMKPQVAEFMLNTMDYAPLRLKVALAQAMKRR
jgi:hypothetical protein